MRNANYVIFMRSEGASWRRRRTIDITPGARWTSWLRAAVLGAAVVIVLPPVWLAMGLLLFVFAFLASLTFAVLVVRAWWAAQGRRD